MPLWDWLSGITQQNLGEICAKEARRQRRCSPVFLWLFSWPLCWHTRSRRRRSCWCFAGRSTWSTMCCTALSGRFFAHTRTRFLEHLRRTHASIMVIEILSCSSLTYPTTKYPSTSNCHSYPLSPRVYRKTTQDLSRSYSKVISHRDDLKFTSFPLAC